MRTAGIGCISASAAFAFGRAVEAWRGNRKPNRCRTRLRSFLLTTPSPLMSAKVVNEAGPPGHSLGAGRRNNPGY